MDFSGNKNEKNLLIVEDLTNTKDKKTNTDTWLHLFSHALTIGTRYFRHSSLNLNTVQLVQNLAARLVLDD